MDLYEALKGNTTEEELIRKFTEELNAAKEKLREEEERETRLKKDRDALIAAMITYLNTAGYENRFSYKDIENKLKNFENDKYFLSAGTINDILNTWMKFVI